MSQAHNAPLHAHSNAAHSLHRHPLNVGRFAWKSSPTRLSRRAQTNILALIIVSHYRAWLRVATEISTIRCCYDLCGMVWCAFWRLGQGKLPNGGSERERTTVFVPCFFPLPHSPDWDTVKHLPTGGNKHTPERMTIIQRKTKQVWRKTCPSVCRCRAPCIGLVSLWRDEVFRWWSPRWQSPTISGT